MISKQDFRVFLFVEKTSYNQIVSSSIFMYMQTSEFQTRIMLNTALTDEQEWKVIYKQKDPPNLKVDALRLQNNLELKSYKVKELLVKYFKVPLGFEPGTFGLQDLASNAKLKYEQGFLIKSHAFVNCNVF